MKRNRRVLSDTLKRSRAGFAAAVLALACAAAVFFLYGLPPEPLVYAGVLTAFLGLAAFAAAYARALSGARRRERMIAAVLTEAELPPAETLAEEDYQAAVHLLRSRLTELQNSYAQRRQEETDYYTAWVHQIKTPIAVMQMELGGAVEPRLLEAELFRIERYVDMVLQYARLDSDSSDLLIREYPLDELIREAVRKFAPQFVAKRLRLDYAGAEGLIVTDRKWFSCILEQLLSNAIKYTPAGSITIALEQEALHISDTGIGIAPEDVPRVFERGYTGVNGRVEKHSSGLGLYLCKKAGELLQIPLSVESTVGKGSRFSLELAGKLRQ